jgi:AraC-like DNA-binding protein
MARNFLSRSFTRYLLSYVLCLILPLVVFTLIFEPIFLSAYSNQLVEKTTKSLDDTFENIDLQINNLSHITAQILSSYQFSDAYLKDNPRILIYLSVQKILGTYHVTNELIFDIWFFDRNNACFYSPSHLLPINSFVRYGPDYSAFDDGIVTDLLGYNTNRWIPETEISIFNEVYPLLTYIASYPNSHTHRNSVLALLVRKDVFERALKPIVPYERSTTAVIDGDGQIIYSLNQAMRPAMEKVIETGLLSGEEGSRLIKAGKEKYFVHMRRFPQNNLTFLSLISHRELSGTVQKYSFTFFCMLLVIILCGSLLIFFLMRYNYQPIQRIIRYSREHIGVLFGREGGTRRQGMNDIDLIRTTLENISEENISLAMRNEKHRREDMLFRLLKGNSINSERLRDAGIDTGGAEYTAAIFQFQEQKIIQIDEIEDLLRRASILLSLPFDVYLLEYLEYNSFIGIFICHREMPCFGRDLERLCSEIMKETRSEIKAAYGTSVRTIGEVSLSYAQARMVLRYRIQRGARNILGFQDMKMEEIPDYLYLRAELNTLEDAIAAGNPLKVNFIISELIDTINYKNTSYFFAVCLCYDIINTFIREIYKTNNAAATEIIKKHQKMFLENFDHPVENLIAIVLSLARETLRVIERDAASPVPVSRNTVLKYIEDNYRNRDFCVQTVSDHFGVSFSNLSHQFKSYTGENISSYISALKMNYAKELLSTTTTTVSEIAARLGYFQTSSFIKKFRGIEGMTPGKYRYKYKNAGSA